MPRPGAVLIGLLPIQIIDQGSTFIGGLLITSVISSTLKIGNTYPLSFYSNTTF